jgi:hypothetical protein
MNLGVKTKEKISKLLFASLFLAMTICFPVGALAACDCDPNVDIVCNPLKFCKFQDLIDALINTLFVVALAIVPLMIVWAGMLFITGNGDPNKLSKAKNIMLYTVIGLGIILLSRAIVWAVKNVLGVSP